MLENFQLGLDVATAVSVIGAAIAFYMKLARDRVRDRDRRHIDETWTYFKEAVDDINRHKLEVYHQVNKLFHETGDKGELNKPVTENDFKMIKNIQVSTENLILLFRDDITVNIINVLEYYKINKSVKDNITEAINDAMDKVSKYSSKDLPQLVNGAIKTGVTKEKLIQSITDLTVAHLSDKELQSLADILNEFNGKLLKQIQEIQ